MSVTRAMVGVVLLSLLVSLTEATFYRAPTFTLDLDKAPEERWKGAVGKILALHPFNDSFLPVMIMYQPIEFALISADTQVQLEAMLRRRFPIQYREIVGIAQDFADNGHPEVNTSTLALWVWFYEFGSLNLTSVPESNSPFFHKACTGVLALPEDRNKEILHGRNMDEDPRGGKNCSLDITVMKSGKVVYRLYDWTWWWNAFWTAAKPNAVTLQWNWRTHRQVPLNAILDRLLNENDTMPTAFMFRTVLDANYTFDDAVHFFNTTNFASPFYIIMSGKGRRGAVLSVSWEMSMNNVSILTDASMPRWYMVQTNYDRWLPDPADDPRRTVAEEALHTLGHSDAATRLGIWMTMSTYPVHNPTTMFTTLLSVSPDEPGIQGYIRTAMKPDPEHRHYP